MRRWALLFLMALLLLLDCSPEPVVEKNIVYVTRGNSELKLDLARPARGRGPFPALILASGFGYRQSGKGYFQAELLDAARRGYVAIEMDYRTTRPKRAGQVRYPFPSQLDDARCALRWLRTNAEEYRVDVDRIGVIGFSSGANLVLMLGLADPSSDFVGDCGDVGPVQAVVNLGGTTDWVATFEAHPSGAKALLGGTPQEVPAVYHAASPISHVTPDDPPVLTVCGSEDDFLSQEQLLDQKMTAVGASHVLHVVQGGTTYRVQAEYADKKPVVDLTQDDPVWTFLDSHLKTGKR